MAELTKQERRALAKEEKEKAREKQESLGKTKNLLLWGLVVAALLFGGYKFFSWFTSPDTRPGVAVEDIGAEHSVDITGISYNSNPPTSGTHFPIWAKRGVYDRVISDGHLIHSLEHGYIVLSYNCDVPATSKKSPLTVFAHEEEITLPEGYDATQSGDLLHMKVGLDGTMSAFTPENAPDVEVELSEAFGSEECSELVENLSTFLDDWQRVIIVPRPNLKTQLALTAWGRLDTLDTFDNERIEAFIKAFHNKGPEQTIED